MKNSKYKELEKLNREIIVPLKEVLLWAGKLAKDERPMPLDIMKNIIKVHNNSLKIKELLEEPEEVKTKYKDQKLFP